MARDRMAELIDALSKDDASVASNAAADALRLVADRLQVIEALTAPKYQDRMFKNPFQIATVNPGTDQEVYRQSCPKGFVGVVTAMGNDWFPNTVLTRMIDNRLAEPKIERSIAPVTAPMQVRIFMTDKVIWRAQNNSVAPLTFGVLTDGFYIPSDIANRAMAMENEQPKTYEE